MAAVIIGIAIGLGLVAIGIFGLGRESAQDGDGIADDLQELADSLTGGVEAGTKGIVALTGLVVAGGIIFLGTRFVKG